MDGIWNRIWNGTWNEYGMKCMKETLKKRILKHAVVLYGHCQQVVDMDRYKIAGQVSASFAGPQYRYKYPMNIHIYI